MTNGEAYHVTIRAPAGYNPVMNIVAIALTLVLLTNGVRNVHADYRLRILKDRPVAYWCFDESAGLTFRNEVSGEANGRHISAAVNRRRITCDVVKWNLEWQKGRER
jgi:hypothetical protein